MKNLLLSITIVLSTVSFSQIHYIETGGGVNISTIYNSFPFNSTSPIYRGSFSFGYTYKFSNKLTLGTNIAYSQSGFKDQIIFTDVLGNDLGVNDVFTLYLTEYISIPLKIGIETGSDKMSFSGSIGIVPAFNVGARIKYPIVNSELNVIDYSVWKLSANSVQFSAQLDAAIGFRVSPRLTLIVKGRVINLGFTNIFSSTSTVGGFKAYTFENTISLGIRYQLKKSEKPKQN